MSRIRFYILYSMLKATAYLPFKALYKISDFIYFMMRYIIGYRREIVYGNLRRSFPEKNAGEIDAIADGFYRHLADVIVETIKMLHISDRQLHRHIEVRNAGLIEQMATDGRPIVQFLGHYGNWEWVQEVTRYYNHPEYSCELYRPIHDKVFDDIMKRIRGRFDTGLIPQKKAIRELIRLHHSGKQFLVGFISDQRPYSLSLQHHWTTFLNQDTAFVTGGEEIGRHINAHFAFLEIEKPSRGHYIMTFREMNISNLGNSDYPYTQLYMHMLEANIRKQPELWLWSHNRWKYDRNGEKINYSIPKDNNTK